MEDLKKGQVENERERERKKIKSDTGIHQPRVSGDSPPPPFLRNGWAPALSNNEAQKEDDVRLLSIKHQQKPVRLRATLPSSCPRKKKN